MNSVSAQPPALAKGNLMRYTLNADGQLKWIDSEVTSSAEDDGALTLMAPEENSYYLVGSFQGQIYSPSSTVIFKLLTLNATIYAIRITEGNKQHYRFKR